MIALHGADEAPYAPYGCDCPAELGVAQPAAQHLPATLCMKDYIAMCWLLRAAVCTLIVGEVPGMLVGEFPSQCWPITASRQHHHALCAKCVHRATGVAMQT